MDCRILLWNQRAEELFGWTKKQAQGKKFNVLLKSEFEKPIEEVLCDLLRDGHWRGIFANQHKDGRKITIMADWRILKRSQKNHIILAWYTDISELIDLQKKVAAIAPEIHELNSRFAMSQVEDRERISREFHDEVGQAITVAKLIIYQVNLTLRPGGATRIIQKRLKLAISALDAAGKLVQQICGKLRLAVLDNVSLTVAIRRHARLITRMSRGRLNIKVDPKLRLDRNASMALFKILKESLTNITRHSKAGRVSVSLLRRKGFAELTIHDDGIGVQKHKISIDGSLGFLGMKERASAVGGTVDIVSRPGKGTTVHAHLPISR